VLERGLSLCMQASLLCQCSQTVKWTVPAARQVRLPK
jgi:hypothetical protein